MFLVSQSGSEIEPVARYSRVWHLLRVPPRPCPRQRLNIFPRSAPVTRFSALIFPRLKPQDLIGSDSCPMINSVITSLVHSLRQ